MSPFVLFTNAFPLLHSTLSEMDIATPAFLKHLFACICLFFAYLSTLNLSVPLIFSISVQLDM